MDAKALAKSKRAHSLHHKKKHHSQQGLKASSPSAGSDFKQASERPAKSEGQQAKERTSQFQSSREIPSNWNRYGDADFGLASENAREISSQLTEFVMPKSKGADYAHMISEAQLDYSSDLVPLFDDFIGASMWQGTRALGYLFKEEFRSTMLCRVYVSRTRHRCGHNCDFGSMLAAKGQSMLSWIADDSFEFEGNASITPQAPFLSLNLDALAEQLAKQSCRRAWKQNSSFLDPYETSSRYGDLNAFKSILDEARGEDKQAPQTATSTSSLSNDHSVTATGDLLVQTSKEEPNPSKKNTDQILQPQATNRSNSTSGKPSKFEETAAEAELDELLNSFSDTAVPREQRIPLSGDAVDILREETSWIVSSNANIESVSSSKNPISKSGIVDDFGSWLDTI
ncbi:hypothetical protein SASPL_132476 [Salvia splendens]|uniref:Uncharacterized protein n=1 Tax=Salvia splendens TaxID=180675 RepID=A0A8X8X296_SALSN|nr:hypothetical protein SASPL_132476 [Salvia splendens]